MRILYKYVPPYSLSLTYHSDYYLTEKSVILMIRLDRYLCSLCFINMFSSSASEQYLTCGLRVNPQSSGWYESLTKVLKRLKGATYTVDAEQGMALVSGRANPKTILRKLKKSGSDVAWIKTGKPPNNYGDNGYYGSNPYLQHPHHHHHPYQYGYHYGSYFDPYVPNPPHFDPYSYWSTRYY